MQVLINILQNLVERKALVKCDSEEKDEHFLTESDHKPELPYRINFQGTKG